MRKTDEIEMTMEEAEASSCSLMFCSHKQESCPALTRTNSSTSSDTGGDDVSTLLSSSAEESLSWSNFPFVVRHELHPSFSTIKPQEDERMASSELETEEEEEQEVQETPQPEHHPQEHLLLKLNLTLEEAAPVTSFGWGDFPLVQAPSFDYPWRYHVVAEDEQIVPLTSPSHPAAAAVASQDEEEEETTATHHARTKRHHQNDERSVSFSVVRIREYAERLGDHPWCPQYPVSLDWTYHAAEETVVCLEAYEQARETCCWSSTPRRMDVLERRSRLARAMRISHAELDVMERYRQEEAAEEEQQAAANEAGGTVQAGSSSRHAPRSHHDCASGGSGGSMIRIAVLGTRFSNLETFVNLTF